MSHPRFDIEALPKIWDLDLNTEWLIEGLIPLGCVAMLSGDSGSGKSTLALALANAVAHGTPFLGRETRQTPVLIVDKENGIYTYASRLERLHIERTDNLHVWPHWFTYEADGPDDICILDFVRKAHPLVIFDSLISFHPGSEQDASETREYMDKYRLLAGAGATVIIIHHTGKGENTKNYRGSSDIKASVDVAYVMTAKPGLENIRLRPFKSREGNIDEICLRYDDGTFFEEKDPHRALLETLLTEQPGMNGSALAAALSEAMPPYRVRKLLATGLDHGWLRQERGDGHSYKYFLV